RRRGGSDVAVVGPAFAAAALEHGVAALYITGRKVFLRGKTRIDRGEVRIGGSHQLVEAIDDEVRFLEGIDAVAGAHDPLQIEADPVRRRRLQRVQRFALRRDDAGAVDAQA